MSKSKIRSLSEDELKSAIAELEKKYPIHTVPENYEAIYKECVNTLGGLFSEHTSINDEKRRFFFMRVRDAYTFKNQNEVNDPKQYSYKSAKICTDIGRAHLPHHPVFYASDSFETAIKEIKKPSVDKYYISIWHTDEISLEKLNFLSATSIKSKRLIKYFETFMSDIDKKFPNYDGFNRNRLKAHVRAWSDLFLSNNYTLSASIAHQKLYNSNSQFDIITYCSAVDKSGINYAIHPRLANKLKLYKVFSSITDGNKTSVMQCAQPGKDNILKWRQAVESDLIENDPFIPTGIDSNQTS
ncbi:RES domain-containing protein [Maribacter algicola]|uniref:RES domain-containing protein n=1 Tax=Meishania litoralis TaxID=3434685 RepID=A0ACC7LIP0_9FLAO